MKRFLKVQAAKKCVCGERSERQEKRKRKIFRENNGREKERK